MLLLPGMKQFLIILLVVCVTLGADYSEASGPLFRDNTYVKLGGSMIAVGKEFDFGPAVAVGKRYLFGRKGVDLSVAFTGGATTGSSHAHTWHIPRALFIAEVPNRTIGCFYWGAGASFGGSRLEGAKFLGIFGEGLLGFNLMFDAPISAFLEVSASQPAIRVRERSRGLYSPTLTGTFGIGF